MEWLKKLIEAAQIKDGKLDIEALMTQINTEFPKNAVPKDTYNALAETKKQLEKDVSTRDKQIDELKKVDAAGLQSTIEKLQQENKDAADKYAADMKDITLTNAIKMAINGKVHDEGIVAGLFDKSKLVVDGEKVVGLDDQIKGLKESKAFLFKPEDTQTQKPGFQVGVAGGNGSGAATDDQLASIFGNTTTK